MHVQQQSCVKASCAGLAVMGDITYRHVFQDTTSDTRRVSMSVPPPADFTEDSPFGRAPPALPEPAQQTPGQSSETGSPRYYLA